MLSEVELSRLKGFEVWRGGFGGIAWKGEVNVNGVDLDSSVTIGRGYVAVRDGGCLNAPAQVRSCVLSHTLSCLSPRLLFCFSFVAVVTFFMCILHGFMALTGSSIEFGLVGVACRCLGV